MVDLVLSARHLSVFRLLLGVHGIALILLHGVVVEVGLVLRLQLGEDLIADACIAVDTVAGVVLIVFVATPIGVVVVLDGRIVNTAHVPRALCAVGQEIEFLELIHVELSLTPLRELHHDVVVAVTGFLTSLGAVVEVVDRGEDIQSLVLAGDVSADVEDVFILAAVGLVAFERGVGIGDAVGAVVVDVRDCHVVSIADSCVKEVADIACRRAPRRCGGVALLAADAPFEQVVP